MLPPTTHPLSVIRVTNRAYETERTYRADGRSRQPDLEAVDGVTAVRRLPDVDLDALYFDTPALDLAAHGITLRRRTGGDDAGWTLKLPTGSPDEREEVHLSLSSGTPRSVPVSLSREVAVHVRGRRLKPVARIVDHRERRQLLDAGGTPLAEVTTDHVTATRPPSSGKARRWKETEVELLAGDRTLLDAAERRLREAGLRPADISGKLPHALGDAMPAPAGPPEADGTVGALVVTRLHRHVSTLKELDPAVRHDTPDAVHRMRVAARRLRATLRSFRRELDPETTTPIAEELRWLGQALGLERDREVFAERLEALAGDPDPAAAEAVAAVDLPSPEASHATVLRKLRSQRYYDLLDALDGLLAHPPLTHRAARPAGRAVTQAVVRDQRRLARRIAAANAAGTGHERDVALHGARKAAKRARYTAETASAVLGGTARKQAQRLKKVQQVLGEYQDSVMARHEIARLARAAHREGADTFAHGLLHRMETENSYVAEAALPKAWQRADRKPWRG